MEDYKEKYEQALERARVWKEKSGMPIDRQGILDDIFPELKESEDERIRKDIIKVFTGEVGFTTKEEAKKYVAWLEKQGEQKPQIKLVFPKFRVGDIIQHIPLEKWDTTKKITHIDETGYYFDHSHQGDTISGGFIGFSFENDYELVEQKPTWSEEDEMMLQQITQCLISLSEECEVDLNDKLDWLKSFKERMKGETK